MDNPQMVGIYLRSFGVKGRTFLEFSDDVVNLEKLQQRVFQVICHDDFKLYYNGKVVTAGTEIPNGGTIEAVSCLLGGKGGFGSMLRAIGAQIEKTTNREACRDLSGRRLRDINEEQRLKRWIAKEAEREAEKARRKKERLERLKSQPKHNFVDFEYEKEISQIHERVGDALTKGLQKSETVTSEKRKAPTAAAAASSSKKCRYWMGDDDVSDDSEVSGDDYSQTNATETKLGQDSDSSQNFEATSSKSCTTDVSGDETTADEQPKLERSEKIEEQIVSPDSCDTTESSAVEVSIQNEKKQEEEAAETIPTSTEQVISSDSCSAESSGLLAMLPKPISDNDKSVNENSEVQSTCQAVQIDSEQSNSSELTSATETETEDEMIDLLSFDTPVQLEQFGLEKLKLELITRGLKCGGTLNDRAMRLWQVRGLKPEKYPSNLLAKKK